MLKKVTPYHYEEIIKRGYSLDIIYLLKLIEQQFDIKPLCDGNVKIAVLYSTLIRKGLITDKDELTLIGQDLLLFINSKETIKLLKRKPATEEFETWWKTFPGTDTFVHKNKTFSGCRSLRAGKEDCKIKFNKILLEGEYTALQLIESLQYDVLQKKENSVLNGANKLTYMQNSLTYLNQRSFEPFIELIEAGIQIKETTNISYKRIDI